MIWEKSVIKGKSVMSFNSFSILFSNIACFQRDLAKEDSSVTHNKVADTSSLTWVNQEVGIDIDLLVVLFVSVVSCIFLIFVKLNSFTQLNHIP